MHWQDAILLAEPAPMDDAAAANLGRNIAQLRQARGLSQQQIARLAGIPRATWANLESGEANPTLAVLVAVAKALQVRLEELIEPPRRTGRHYPAAALPVRRRGTVTVRKLLPETIAGLEIERMELPPGGAMPGIPHTPGTREYLTCESGRDRAVRRRRALAARTPATWSSSAATSATATATWAPPPPSPTAWSPSPPSRCEAAQKAGIEPQHALADLVGEVEALVGPEGHAAQAAWLGVGLHRRHAGCHRA